VDVEREELGKRERELHETHQRLGSARDSVKDFRAGTSTARPRGEDSKVSAVSLDGRRAQTGGWTNRKKDPPKERPKSAMSRTTVPTARTHTTTRSEAEAELTFGVDMWETKKQTSYTKKHYMPGRDNLDNYGDEKIAVNTMFKINYGW